MVGKIRVTLAGKGMGGGNIVGYEIFDDTSSLGTTNFIQNVNLLRALEGELSRTIKSIANVSSARVHLVLPKRQLFTRQAQEPSATIMLKMSGPSRLGPEQVSAVQYLVAAAGRSFLAKGRPVPLAVASAACFEELPAQLS